MSALYTLQRELCQLRLHPVEGFTTPEPCANNMLEWDVAIFGPPDTLYQGGYFRARLSFPTNYPFQPPKMRFISSLWHPNIYRSGEICISILHSPNDDPLSGERVQERWNPTLGVRTILLSVISMLSEPNVSSPANIDASVQYRLWRERSAPKYAEMVRKDVERSRVEAARDGVEVPECIADYLKPTQVSAAKELSSASRPHRSAEDVFASLADDDDENDG